MDVGGSGWRLVVDFARGRGVKLVTGVSVPWTAA